MERLERQIRFVLEIDKLKNVFRQSFITDGSRYENDVEHSWHLAMMILLLSEHSNEPEFDTTRAMKMVLIHDIVEIDAGDTFAYDAEGHRDKEARERAAADRLFGLLPSDQRQEFQELWEEFERRETPEARFAGAVDRMQPILQNYFCQGKSWKEHQIRKEQVIERNQSMRDGSETLWRFIEKLIDDAVEKGYLLP